MNTTTRDTLEIVTVNAHEGRFIRSGGLSDFADVDAILMQETHPDRDDLEAQLNKHTDLRLVLGSPATRLALAVHKEHDILSKKETVIQAAGTAIRGLRATLSFESRIIRRFRDRGFLSAEIDFDGAPVHIVTSHVNVAARPLKRAAHLDETPRVLSKYPGSLIYAGDMNHWPGPRAADVRMQLAANLARVPLDDPTWVSEESNFQQRTLGSVLARYGKTMDAEMDAVFWRDDGSLRLIEARALPVQSDHRAIWSKFSRPKDFSIQ